MKKVFVRICAMVVLGLIAVFIFFMLKNENTTQNFDENGLTTVATIQSFSQEKTNDPSVKYKSKILYFAHINYFVKETDTRSGNKVIEEKVDDDKSIDELFKDISNKISSGIGDFSRAKLEISLSEYKKLENQKEVEILYLKDDPKKITLKSRIN